MTWFLGSRETRKNPDAVVQGLSLYTRFSEKFGKIPGKTSVPDIKKHSFF